MVSPEFESRLALQGVLDSPFIPGAMETLDQLKNQNIPCFVASGTPDEEIKVIVKKKDLSAYFVEVHGSPRTKDQIISDIAGRYEYDLTLCLFIGDAMTDYKAARSADTKFLGIVSQNEKSPFPADTWVKQQLELFKDNEYKYTKK